MKRLAFLVLGAVVAGCAPRAVSDTQTLLRPVVDVRATLTANLDTVVFTNTASEATLGEDRAPTVYLRGTRDLTVQLASPSGANACAPRDVPGTWGCTLPTVPPHASVAVRVTAGRVLSGNAVFYRASSGPTALPVFLEPSK